MAKKISITLYDGGAVVASYPDVEIVTAKTGNFNLVFKVKEDQPSVRGKAFDKVVTHTFTTTLPSIIEEVIEHSGLISV
jgi:hypothetical protein